MVRWAAALGVPAGLLWFDTGQPDNESGRHDKETTVGQHQQDGGGLRVGIVAPPWVPVPPPAYGGTELVLDVLARGLAARGHEVALFATGDSTCDVKRLWEYPVAFGNGIGTTAIELNHTAAAYAALAGCDIVHDHTLAGLYVSLTDPALPVVTTSHGPFTAPELADVYRRTAYRVPVIAISHDQAAGAGPAGIDVAAVVHHGLDLGAYRYDPHGGDYVAVLGRMHPDKGIDRAITLARQAGVEVKIAAKMREPAEHAYYHDMIRPLVGPGVEYLARSTTTPRSNCWPGPKHC